MADMGASVLAKLRNKAKETGRSNQLCMQLFCQEEFLRRLEKSKYYCYFFRNTKNNTFAEMISLLQALANDDEYFELSSHEETFSENPKKRY